MLFRTNVGAGRLISAIRGGALGVVVAAALAGCSGSSSGDKVRVAPREAASLGDGPGVPQRMRLITREQYTNTLAYIFGPDLHVDARFAPMTRTDGLLETGAAFAGISAAQLEQFQGAAVRVAAAVMDPEHRRFLIPCKPKDDKTADTACAARFLAGTGRLLYRKPLPAARLAHFTEEADAAAAKLNGFYPGLAVALEGMLMSPEVLFITDKYEPDPRHKGKFRLDAYSLAQRLSFFLWNAAPDDAILKAAESGEIQTANGRARVVDAMLASPRLEVGMRAFFEDMMGFEDFDKLAKDPNIYPAFTGVAVTDAREETLRTIVNHLLTEKRDYRDLFTTRETFLSPTLATLYGAQTQAGWTPYEFPETSGRAGIETQISFLALHAHPGRSSPTLRGKALREILLCQPVPHPPANVDFSALENPRAEQRTQRDRVAFHLKNPVCAGCHKITDPIGLGLELFDGAGVHRTAERSTPIDASGVLDGASFADTVGLARALHDHPALTSCFVRRIYGYGTGGPVVSEEAPLLAYFNRKFAEDGYRLPDLLRSIALSPVFAEVIPQTRPGPAQKMAAGAQSTAPNVN